MSNNYTMVDLLNDETKELIENLPQVKQLKQELEVLKEDNKRLNELLVGGTEVIDYWTNKYLEEQAKNTELQKQVDELKEQRDVFKRLFESVNTSHFSTNSIIETMNSFYREQAEHLAGLKIEQAVKDIAPLAIQRFINQLDIDEIIRVDSDLGKELLKEKEFILKRYYNMEI